MGRESGLGVGSVSGTFLMLDWEATGLGRFAVGFFGFRVLGLAGMVITQLERRVTGIYCLVCVLF